MEAHIYTGSEQPVKVAAEALRRELNLGDELAGRLRGLRRCTTPTRPPRRCVR